MTAPQKNMPRCQNNTIENNMPLGQTQLFENQVSVPNVFDNKM